MLLAVTCNPCANPEWWTVAEGDAVLRATRYRDRLPKGPAGMGSFGL